MPNELFQCCFLINYEKSLGIIRKRTSFFEVAVMIQEQLGSDFIQVRSVKAKDAGLGEGLQRNAERSQNWPETVEDLAAYCGVKSLDPLKEFQLVEKVEPDKGVARVSFRNIKPEEFRYCVERMLTDPLEVDYV